MANSTTGASESTRLHTERATNAGGVAGMVSSGNVFARPTLMLNNIGLKDSVGSLNGGRQMYDDLAIDYGEPDFDTVYDRGKLVAWRIVFYSSDILSENMSTKLGYAHKKPFVTHRFKAGGLSEFPSDVTLSKDSIAKIGLGDIERDHNIENFVPGLTTIASWYGAERWVDTSGNVVSNTTDIYKDYWRLPSAWPTHNLGIAGLSVSDELSFVAKVDKHCDYTASVLAWVARQQADTWCVSEIKAWMSSFQDSIKEAQKPGDPFEKMDYLRDSNESLSNRLTQIEGTFNDRIKQYKSIIRTATEQCYSQVTLDIKEDMGNNDYGVANELRNWMMAYASTVDDNEDMFRNTLLQTKTNLVKAESYFQGQNAASAKASYEQVKQQAESNKNSTIGTILAVVSVIGIVALAILTGGKAHDDHDPEHEPPPVGITSPVPSPTGN